ncbi:MAG: GNAT family N-acetyltransferase [Brevinematales bacterium]|nr:GNAT family N-acetyltransferase [Brevinematales bacterium]
MERLEKLSGRKCYLSPLREEDTYILAKWQNDPEVSFPLNNTHRQLDMNAEKEFLEMIRQNGWHYFIIVARNDGEPIGACFLLEVDMHNRTAEFGIFIGDKTRWKQGYATEATRLILDYGFRVLTLHNIWLRVFAFNTAAMKVYRRVGFKEIGFQREIRLMNGKYYDFYMMDILSEEFEGVNHGTVG